ncbi:hypothetical protein [Dyadobacter aurulentus]|uniref:hypothetical protein n=1 Tax=Dyadobacter sp. UC 10 TaxID=2605428 RepID=UPI0011F14710|nr:hypothetical protein [Dyadobacter sp. UC 10]KAA0992765.1 hypothetical protein FXO21_22600 [Dyadobacter sp. UC 10]
MNATGYIQVRPFTGYTPQIDAERANLNEYVQLDGQIKPGYLIPAENTNTGKNEPRPDLSSGFDYSLPSGKALPAQNTEIIARGQKVYYFEEKELVQRFWPIGKTIEECSRKSGEVLGLYTGKHFFGGTTTAGIKKITALEVKTKFPFDRQGNAVETEYTLWVTASSFDYKLPSEISQQPTGNGYETGTDNPAGSQTSKEKNSQLLTLAAIGAGLYFLTRKRK